MALGKIVTCGLPESIARTIGPPVSQVHMHCTRRADQRILPRIRSEAGRRRLCYRGVELLNGMGIEPSVASFKGDVKAYLLLENDVT